MRHLLTAVILVVSLAVEAQTPNHGQVTRTDKGLWSARDATTQTHVEPETFWLMYAERRGGLTWGRSNTFPNYKDVKEHDTLLIELDQGTCLMEFFHTRWRRANDVRRWDDAFNEYGACPYVFD